MAFLDTRDRVHAGRVRGALARPRAGASLASPARFSWRAHATHARAEQRRAYMLHVVVEEVARDPVRDASQRLRAAGVVREQLQRACVRTRSCAPQRQRVCVCVGAHTRAEHTRAASSAVSRIQRAAPSSSCPTATAARDVRVPQARTHGLD